VFGDIPNHKRQNNCPGNDQQAYDAADNLAPPAGC